VCAATPTTTLAASDFASIAFASSAHPFGMERELRRVRGLAARTERLARWGGRSIRIASSRSMMMRRMSALSSRGSSGSDSMSMAPRRAERIRAEGRRQRDAETFAPASPQALQHHGEIAARDLEAGRAAQRQGESTRWRRGESVA
jgi:hypothetical protein